MLEVALAPGVAVITGAGRGMGAATARQMVAGGWKELLLCDLDPVGLGDLAKALRALGAEIDVYVGDVADRNYGAGLVEHLGTRAVGALIHAAGVSPPRISDVDRIFEVNLDGALRLLAALRTRLADGSAVVFFASIAGHLPVSPDADIAFDARLPADGSVGLRHFAEDAIAAYLLSKRAILAAVRHEAKPLYAERGARLVSVSPGMIDTPMTEGVENDLTRSLISGAAIPRYGRAEEVAAACVFLCSPAASFICGCDILIDGGELAGLVRST